MLRNRCFSLLTKPLPRHTLTPFSFSFGTYNKNFYQVLGIPQSASPAEIKSAYYKLAKQHHPDVNKGGEETFKAISTAYETLSDNSKKRQYDDTLRYSSTSTSSSSSTSYGAYTSPRQGPNYKKNYKQRPYTNNDYDDYYEDDFPTGERGRQARGYYQDFRQQDRYRYPKNDREFRESYDEFRRTWNDDFEETKSKEYKEQERRQAVKKVLNVNVMCIGV